MLTPQIVTTSDIGKELLVAVLKFVVLFSIFFIMAWPLLFTLYLNLIIFNSL